MHNEGRQAGSWTISRTSGVNRHAYLERLTALSIILDDVNVRLGPFDLVVFQVSTCISLSPYRHMPPSLCLQKGNATLRHWRANMNCEWCFCDTKPYGVIRSRECLGTSSAPREFSCVRQCRFFRPASNVIASDVQREIKRSVILP